MSNIETEKKKWAEYYSGLKDAMRPNFTLSPGISEDDIISFNNIYNAILEDVAEDGIVSLFMDNNTKLYMVYPFVAQPLLQVFDYTSENMITIEDAEEIDNGYQITDVDTIIDFLSGLQKIGRERLLNIISIPQSKFNEVYKAIVEQNRNSLVELLESHDLDYSWLTKLAGIKQRGNDICELLTKPELDEWDYDVITHFLAQFSYDSPNPYIAKLADYQASVNLLSEKEATNYYYYLTKLIVKSYWFQRHIYTSKTQSIIDDYLGKKCFSSFINECRAEFEEEEKKRIDDSNDKYGWLPADFFNVANTPSGGENWIKGLLSEVEKGYKYKNDPREKDDARIKFAMMIEQCVREGLIHDDNDSRKRLAYLLTGRKVGISINENKVITINEDKLSVLIYIVRFLFKKNGKYNKMFSLVDGVGKKQTKVSSVAELEEQKNSPHMYTQKYFSRLAEKTEVFKSFGPFMHSLYDFCPESEAALREKNRETKLAKEIRRRLKEDHDEARRKGKE